MVDSTNKEYKPSIAASVKNVDLKTFSVDCSEGDLVSKKLSAQDDAKTARTIKKYFILFISLIFKMLY